MGYSFAEVVIDIDKKFNIKPEPQSKPPVDEKIELKKDKKGRYQVGWRLFNDYDEKKNKAGKNLSKIIDKEITIKGFMVPLDFAAKNIKEFLLVPYMPSCAHVPPPPPNMIINVKVGKKSGIKPSYYPVTVTGKLSYDKKPPPSSQFMPSGVFTMKSLEIKEVKR